MKFLLILILDKSHCVSSSKFSPNHWSSSSLIVPNIKFVAFFVRIIFIFTWFNWWGLCWQPQYSSWTLTQWTRAAWTIFISLFSFIVYQSKLYKNWIFEMSCSWKSPNLWTIQAQEVSAPLSTLMLVDAPDYRGYFVKFIGKHVFKNSKYFFTHLSKIIFLSEHFLGV